MTTEHVRRLRKELFMILGLATLVFTLGAVVMIRSTAFVQSSMALVGMTDADLARAADTIVLADVSSQSTQVAPTLTGGGRVLTSTTLRVARTLKGPAQPTILVTTRGGDAGSIIERTPDEASFAPGQRVLVFLHQDPNLGLTVLGGLQGRYLVTGTVASNEVHQIALDDLIAGITGGR